MLCVVVLLQPPFDTGLSFVPSPCCHTLSACPPAPTDPPSERAMDEGAFSRLAAPLVPPANGHPGEDAEPDTAKLNAFYAQEMQLFWLHMRQAREHFKETGELPHSLFT